MGLELEDPGKAGHSVQGRWQAENISLSTGACSRKGGVEGAFLPAARFLFKKWCDQNLEAFPKKEGRGLKRGPSEGAGGHGPPVIPQWSQDLRTGGGEGPCLAEQEEKEVCHFSMHLCDWWAPSPEKAAP